MAGRRAQTVRRRFLCGSVIRLAATHFLSASRPCGPLPGAIEMAEVAFRHIEGFARARGSTANRSGRREPHQLPASRSMFYMTTALG